MISLPRNASSRLGRRSRMIIKARLKATFNEAFSFLFLSRVVGRPFVSNLRRNPVPPSPNKKVNKELTASETGFRFRRLIT